MWPLLRPNNPLQLILQPLCRGATRNRSTEVASGVITLYLVHTHVQQKLKDIISLVGWHQFPSLSIALPHRHPPPRHGSNLVVQNIKSPGNPLSSPWPSAKCQLQNASSQNVVWNLVIKNIHPSISVHKKITRLRGWLDPMSHSMHRVVKKPPFFPYCFTFYSYHWNIFTLMVLTEANVFAHLAKEYDRWRYIYIELSSASLTPVASHDYGHCSYLRYVSHFSK